VRLSGAPSGAGDVVGAAANRRRGAVRRGGLGGGSAPGPGAAMAQHGGPAVLPDNPFQVRGLLCPAAPGPARCELPV